jgi:uroporphyrinogen III methyltransferase/synthase
LDYYVVKHKPHVYLVGAGPGDPDLLTVKASRILGKADVVVYDRLVANDLLKLVPEKAEKIFVGKETGWHNITQDEINEILVDKARAGKDVVRLKGGDPFLFSRGGEEAQELRKAGLQFTIVPGVPSPIAVPAYAGIPLTHRQYASSVVFVTGHEASSKRRKRVDWKKLATTVDTIVILMGTKKLKEIAELLIQGGRPRSTNVAIIEWGTTKNQRTITGTLGNIARKAARHKISPPAIIVIGNVVKLRRTLHWFKKEHTL